MPAGTGAHPDEGQRMARACVLQLGLGGQHALLHHQRRSCVQLRTQLPGRDWLQPPAWQGHSELAGRRVLLPAAYLP